MAELFEHSSRRESPAAAASGRARLRQPVRDEVTLQVCDLDALIGEDHPARLIWAYAARVDLSDFEAGVKAREGAPGMPQTSPHLLLALWLYATTRGIGSARELARFRLAYVHVLEAVATPAGEQVLGTIKAACGAPVIANNGYTLETAQAAIGDGHVDAVAFGKLFIANPDLPRRLRAGGPYNEWDMKTFYGGSEKGYTDYPALPT